MSFDYPGCGDSRYPDQVHFGIDDLVEILKQVIDSLNLKSIVLIGHSTGGMVALRYIIKYPINIIAFLSDRLFQQAKK